MEKDTRKLRDELRRHFRRKGLVLAIGSGVSAKSRIPTWPELLKRLAKRLYQNGGEEVYKALEAVGYTLPAIAGMLECRARDCGLEETDLTDMLRDEIYRQFPFYKRGVRGTGRDDLVRFVQESNTTLRAVAALCVRRAAPGVYVRNPQIHAILNFNFDAILQAYTRARYNSDKHRMLRTIERSSAGAAQGRIPVYHLHGYLVFDQESFRQHSIESPDLRVFTEQEYFDSFNQPTRMGSYAFLHLLREHSILFIGLSLRDDNIRRLLHYSLSERIAGYKAEGASEAEARHRGLRHFALLSAVESAEFKRLTSLSLERLGTKTIWYQDHSEIPELLGEIYGQGWDTVYGVS